MIGPSLLVMDGGQGSGRTPRLLAAMVDAAGVGVRPVVLVDPMSCWTLPDIGSLGPLASVIRGPLARSVEVLDVLSVMAGVAPGLVIGFDDAEHASRDRRRWSSLACVLHTTGGLLLVMMPDLALWSPEGPPGAAKSARSVRRHPGVRAFPGGAGIASLVSAIR